MKGEGEVTGRDPASSFNLGLVLDGCESMMSVERPEIETKQTHERTLLQTQYNQLCGLLSEMAEQLPVLPPVKELCIHPLGTCSDWSAAAPTHGTVVCVGPPLTLGL